MTEQEARAELAELVRPNERFTARSRGHNNGHTWVIGPVLVEVVHHDDGEHTPWYAVHIDGRHQYGAPEHIAPFSDSPLTDVQEAK